MSDSDSEDDFMSDKFLVEAAPARTTQQTYLDRRKAAQKKHLESQPKSLKLREEEKRRKGLETSLFAGVEQDANKPGESSSSSPAVGGKAMSMMMKMGWKVGEGLGKKGDDTAEPTDPRTGGNDAAGKDVEPDEDEGGVPAVRAGIGMGRKRRRSTDPLEAEAPSVTKQRVEPLRVSMWAGKSGLGTRKRSPSPILAPGELHPEKLAQLAATTEDFRKRQSGVNEAKKIEGREWAARKVLVELDEANGLKFHPLHVVPTAPAQTMPVPLLRLVFPHQFEALIVERRDHLARKLGAGPGGRVGVDDTYGNHRRGDDEAGSISLISGKAKDENMTQAARLREMMKQDALEAIEPDLDLDEVAGNMVFGGSATNVGNAVRVDEPHIDELDQEGVDAAPIDWEAQVEGVQRVLGMDPSTHLSYLLDLLRTEHLYCFWCGCRYSTTEEMDGPGGCPGEDEDDH